MRRKEKNSKLISITLGILVTVSLLAIAAVTEAKVVDIKESTFIVNASMKDNIKTFTGERISVILGSGTTLSGTVKTVGDNYLHLEKIEGKDLYDALIAIKDIKAIEAQFRKFE